jgi:non-ribosomal peptide synthetase-like protein
MLTASTASNAIRWKKGERLDHLYERRCDDLPPGHLAVIAEDVEWTFRDLDVAANQIARHFLATGLRSGDRIGLLFDRGPYTYAAMLAVLKINAAYVPLDTGFPNERIQYIASDAELKAIVSMVQFEAKLHEINVPKIYIDTDKAVIQALPIERLSTEERQPATDELAYIIYTSGTTGNPKGVAIEHASICNFVTVAGEVYGILDTDRMFQGMTIAFDFSVEELWVPLIAGAALVPGKKGTTLIGEELADYLEQKGVTTLACVPTLLTTIERDLPKLRLLLVSGEACPHDLVVRWSKRGRSILNAYGPTEATVTCTLTELIPDKPVTIGRPLPTYTIVILDEHEPREIQNGGMGEICVAGVGLARGYVNRDDLTAQKFIPDFLDIEDNPSKRIYRTGDLGRINEHQEIEFHGRIDTQVKVRGYRIELSEIESVLLEVPQIAQTVVNTYTSESGLLELVGYCTLKKGITELPLDDISTTLRSRLPGYMIPAFIEQIPVIPMLPSNKADRKKLPPPTGPRFIATAGEFVSPATATEKTIASIIASVLKIENVSTNDNFFADLGAHSLLMAKVAAIARERLAVPDLSMRDLYLHPNVAQLASFLDSREKRRQATQLETEPYRVASNATYYTCGVFQFLSSYVSYSVLLAVLVLGLHWSFLGPSILETWLRLIAFGTAALLLSIFLPIAVKWLLIGKWKKERIPIWSAKYFRFWMVKQLVQLNPMLLFKGLPLYNLYLRMLGARIGKNVVIYSTYVPVCTDLITIGDNTVLRKDSIVLGYKAEGGYIYTGYTTVGKNAFVGEATVLDIDSAMEDNTQLGHQSCLQSNQKIPAGKRYHGTPAEETSANYCGVEPKVCTTLRRSIYSIFQVISISSFIPTSLLLLYLFSDYLVQGDLLFYFSDLRSLILSQPIEELQSIWALIIFWFSAVFISALIVGLAVIAIVPRLVSYFLEPNKTYVLFGIHYYLFKIVSGVSNSRFYNLLLGDSSVIIYYLRFIGWKLSLAYQTGSNFGTEQKHDSPFLCEIGDGTMVSDGLTMINADISDSSFRLGKVHIGERNYLGNDIHYPAGGKVGKNCLIGTKAMIPIEGCVKENTGLLGSPSFEIPRLVAYNQCLESNKDPSIRRMRIRKKNGHNFFTAGAFLGSRWGYAALAISWGFWTTVLWAYYGLFPVVCFVLGLPFFTIGYFICIARMSIGFGTLEPHICTIYDKAFWRVERYWKLNESFLLRLFIGTPLKNVISRLLGVKVGKKVFDDGCSFSEKILVEVDNYCTLNMAVLLQAHSLEEGIFKSDRIRVGEGCTIGVNALVHYGVCMGENVVLDAHSFLMKGEMPSSNTRWQGNPAMLVVNESESTQMCNVVSIKESVAISRTEGKGRVAAFSSAEEPGVCLGIEG